MKTYFLIIFTVLLPLPLLIAQHPQAHAHNDYAHKRPLLDALEQGFTSVEADIFLIKGKLVVAHTYPVFGRKRTLRKLYLEPLRQKIEENQGSVYPNSDVPFTLMIDFKTGDRETYETLLAELSGYPEMINYQVGGAEVGGPVNIVLSGARPGVEEIKGDTQWVKLDGRPRNLEDTLHVEQIAWISSRWSSHFTWKGNGPMPEEEKVALIEFVTKSHARHAQVRFWATKEKEFVWKQLLEAGVDRISTDKLEKLNQFLLEHNN